MWMILVKMVNSLGGGIIAIAVDDIAIANILCAIIKQLLMEMVVL